MSTHRSPNRDKLPMATSTSFALLPDLTIRILSAPIAVIAGRDSLPMEIAAAPSELRGYLAKCTSSFLAHEDADVAIEEALPDARLTPGIVTKTKSRLLAIASQAE